MSAAATASTSELIPSQLRNSNSNSNSSNNLNTKPNHNNNTGLNKGAKEFVPSHNPKNNNNNNDNSNKNAKKEKKPRSRPRRPRRGTKVSNSNPKDSKEESESTTPDTQTNHNNHHSTLESTSQIKSKSNQTKARRRNRNRKGKKEATVSNPNPTEASATPTATTTATTANVNANVNVSSKNDANNNNTNQNKKKRKPRPNKKKKKFPWRAHIPEGAVDPISLDPLEDLPYPPFALVIEPPYTPIQTFPPSDKPSVNLNLNLFDGRVLAYYLISQLQFIDPLNRRDLTRPELQQLDDYLARHNLGKAHVVQAYDCKGVTISTAGREAQTAQGQARILQEEATSILNALFSGTHSSSNRDRDRDHHQSGTFRNEFERQYMQHEQRQNQRQNNTNTTISTTAYNGGLHEVNDDDYAGSGGLVIIDDDLDPGLRGGLANRRNNRQATTSTTTTTSYANRTQTQGGFGNTIQNTNDLDLFPALHETVTTTTASDSESNHNQSNNNNNNNNINNSNSNSNNNNKPISRSLQFISKTVTKTNPKQIEKQRKAREEMQRRAALSQMSLLTPSTNIYNNNEPPLTITTPQLHLQPQLNSNGLDGQMERNRILAQALNVTPATIRNNINIHSGWARPIRPNKMEYDEFGNELNTTIYPDALIVLGKEELSEVLRLEKRWKSFLLDDKASFLNLRPMMKKLRILVHHYSDFWNLTTESFDKEPKRYINCKKVRETQAPYPLLSEAIRHYRPPPVPHAPPSSSLSSSLPTNTNPTMENSNDNAFATATTTNINTTTSLTPREIPLAPDRTPLPLLPRTITANPPEGTMYDYDYPPQHTSAAISTSTFTPFTNYDNDYDNDTSFTHIPRISSTSRFDVLVARERPKLPLEPRNATITSSTPSPTNINQNDAPPMARTLSSSRFEGLLVRERPKLTLEPRTLPRELPVFPSSSAYASAQDEKKLLFLREKEQLQQQKRQEQQKQKESILAAAFASDDESDGDDDNNDDDDNSDSSSDWEEDEPMYCSSDDDDEDDQA